MFGHTYLAYGRYSDCNYAELAVKFLDTNFEIGEALPMFWLNVSVFI